MLAEPAFSHSTAWPPAGFDGLAPEPDDPRPAIARGALLIEPGLPTAIWQAGSVSLDRPADEPLQAARPVTPTTRQGWQAAILVSCLLHAAVALAFLTGAVDRVEIAGADEAGVMLLGNAPDDQSAAGDGMEATNVTLITMLDPKPVATVRAEAVAGTDTVQPVEESVVEETTQPQFAEPAPERIAAVAEPSTSETVESMAEIAPTPADPTPEVLTAQAAEPTQETVRQHVEPLADTTSIASTAVHAEQADPVVAETTPSAEVEMTEIENLPVPHPKPAEEAKPAEPARPERLIEEDSVKKPAKEKSAKKPQKKIAAKHSPTRKADKTDKTRKRAGSDGSNQADSRRGVADGQTDGRKEVSGKGGVASAAGNAAASNYPGKVAAKLRRAVRSVSRSGRAKASNDVLVSFTVNAGGGLGGVRIARSSGSPDLDKAALAVVRRAAPFPPIPAETGRGSWAFTLPLGMR